MRYLLLLCLLVMSVGMPVAAQANCGLDNRLLNGDVGWVLPSSPNRVRVTPSIEGELMNTLEAGKAFEVIGDAACAENITWVPIKFTTRDEGSWQGWTAESDAITYFVGPVSGTLIAGYGVTALMPIEVAASAEITLHEKEPEIDGNWTLPEYIEITFTGYEDGGENISDTGTITIYRADAIPVKENYNMWEGAFRYHIPEMSLILDTRPDLMSFEPIFNRLPLFSVASATNLLAYRDYLSFQNGEGYHALTSTGQSIFEPTNDSLTYTYVGLTTDGRYFVRARLPVNAAALPGEPVPPVDLDSDEMSEYLRRNGEFFDAQTPGSYTPPLSLIDALINSLYIGD